MPRPRLTPRITAPSTLERTLLAGRVRLGAGTRSSPNSVVSRASAAVGSVALHAMMALLVSASVWLDPARTREPDEHAYVDLVIGTNATRNGGTISSAPAPATSDCTAAYTADRAAIAAGRTTTRNTRRDDAATGPSLNAGI